jgi:hypothetical protein
MPHTQCVAAARASSAVVDFPTDLRRRGIAAGEGPLTWIDGLSEGLVHCYKRGILPSEDGCAWARGGRRVAIAPVAGQAIQGTATPTIAAAAS